MTVNKDEAQSRSLDSPIPEDYLDVCTARIAAPSTTLKPRTKSVLIFRIGDEWLALATEVFQEVAELETPHRLPHRRDQVLTGLVNVRGDLLLCVALEVLLGIKAETHQLQSVAGPRASRLLVCNEKGGRLVFRASEVHGVYRYDPAELRPAAATIAKSGAGTFILGVIPWRDRTVGCLDEELVFHALNKGLQ